MMTSMNFEKNVTALILQTAENCIPSTTVVIRKNDSPIMNNSLRTLTFNTVKRLLLYFEKFNNIE